LLLHGTLPPAHVRTRPFYRDGRLADRAAIVPAALTSDQGALRGRKVPTSAEAVEP
jgi:hypothetical protein